MHVLLTTIAYRDDRELDLEQVAALYRSVGWGERGGDAARVAALVSGSFWVATAWEGERLVGFARVVSDGVTVGYLTDVMVHESARRRGVATALVRGWWRGGSA